MGVFRHGFGRIRIRADSRLAMAEDVSLFPADLLARVAQIGRMIDTDAAQNGAVGVNRVHCVKASAQTDFKNHGVEMRFLENAQNSQTRKFKIGKRRLPAGLVDFLKRLDERFVVHLVSGNHATLVEVQQMRRRMHTHAIPRVTQNGLQQCTGATLAIGACDREHRANKFDAHARNHVLHALKAEIHGLFMDFADVVKPLVQTGLLPGSSKSCCIGH